MVIIIENIQPIIEAVFNTFEDRQDAILFLHDLSLYIKSKNFDAKQFSDELLAQLEDKCVNEGICVYCGSTDLKLEKSGYEDTDAYGIKDKVALFRLVCSECGLIQSDEEL